MELIIIKTTMTSREIAELTGKQHKDVLESIRKMEPAWQKVTGRKFPLSEYVDITGRKLPMYELTKTESLYIATKFNDEARAKLVVRWEQLEINDVAYLKHQLKSIEESVRERLAIQTELLEIDTCIRNKMKRREWLVKRRNQIDRMDFRQLNFGFIK